MAYGDNTLSADHQWTFNNVLTDSIGALTLTNTDGTLVTTPICRDTTHSYQTNGRDDRASVTPDATTGNGADLDRYSIGGWFRVSQVQGPPVLIYKQGGGNGLGIFMWAGNNVMAQCRSGGKVLQIFSDVALTDNRSYHFLLTFEGNTFSNEFSFYLDGVKQLRNRGDVQPASEFLTQFTGEFSFGENGTAGTEMLTGSSSVLTKACVNGFYNQWWTWSGANAVHTADEIKNDIFAAGAIPEFTISSDTQANMQTALDAIADSVRGDVPLAILVEDVSGGGNLTLTADNIQFNSRGSIDIVWEGSGTLTWINSNGANTSRSAVLNSGTVNIVEAVPITITVRDLVTEAAIAGARVLVQEDPGGTIIINDVTDGSGQVTANYQFSGNQNIAGRARKGSSAPYYKNAPFTGTITSDGLSITALMVED